MIFINITDEQGILLGRTELTNEDIQIRMGQPTDACKEWIGEKILDELPRDAKALLACIGEGPDVGD